MFLVGFLTEVSYKKTISFQGPQNSRICFPVEFLITGMNPNKFFFSNSQITDCMTFNIYALIIWRNTHYSLVCQISVPRLSTFEIFVSPWWSYQDLPPFIKILELIFSARKLELQFISEYCSAEVFYSLYSYLCQITRSKCLAFWLECHKNQRYYEDISSIKSVVLICYDIMDIYDIITYQYNRDMD